MAGITLIWKNCKIWSFIVFLVFATISSVLCAFGGMSDEDNDDKQEMALGTRRA